MKVSELIARLSVQSTGFLCVFGAHKRRDLCGNRRPVDEGLDAFSSGLTLDAGGGPHTVQMQLCRIIVQRLRKRGPTSRDLGRMHNASMLCRHCNRISFNFMRHKPVARGVLKDGEHCSHCVLSRVGRDSDGTRQYSV